MANDDMSGVKVRPLLVAQGRQAVFHITGLAPSQNYRLRLLPVAESNTHTDYRISTAADGTAILELAAAWNGESLIDVLPGEDDRPAATLHVFSAPTALAYRRPLRVDFHMHTLHSDGHSPAAEMVIRGRQLGLDALAITDHNKFIGSQEGIQEANRLGLGLICLTGEEVTAWDWHVLSIGASQAIDYRSTDGTGYESMDRIIDRIHALGGRAYLAHPYWVSRRQRNMPSADYDRLLSEGGFDGIELLGDVEWEDNLLSLARYHALDNDNKPPILGNSDTHWSEHTYGGYWTLVFVEKRSPAGILQAIADHFSVACARMPLIPAGAKLDSRLLAFGPFEQVELALFLDRAYYPEHDRLCQVEAALATRLQAGERLPANSMRQAVTAVEDYARECLGE